MYSSSLPGLQPSLPKPIPRCAPVPRHREEPTHTLCRLGAGRCTLLSPISPQLHFTSLCSLQILHNQRGRFWAPKVSIPHLVQTFCNKERKKRRKKVALATPHSHIALGREKVKKHRSQLFYFAFLKNLNTAQFSYLSWRTTDCRIYRCFRSTLTQGKGNVQHSP